MNNLFISTLVTVLSASVVTFGASKEMFCKTELKSFKSCKNITEDRREELGKQVAGGNPVAITNENHELKVWYTVGGKSLQGCTITNNVETFKIASHPGDLSTAYFSKEGDFYDVKTNGAVSATACPKAEKQNYNTSLKLGKDDTIEIKAIGNSHSDITAIARTKNGYLIYSTLTRIYSQYVGPNAEKALDAVVKDLNH